MNLLLIVLVIIVLISLNALYVAAEFATISARRTRVQSLAEAGNRTAQRLLPFLEDNVKLDRYIAACQVGITISSLIVGFYGQAQLAPYLSPFMASGVAIVLALVLLTSLQVIFGELLPKSLALRFPERIAVMTTLPMLWSLALLRPFIAFLNGSALALLRLFGLKASKEMHVHSPEELELIFRESAQGGYIDADERQMLENALSLEQRLARHIMVPRNRMQSAEANCQAGALLEQLRSTPHSRFPVYEGDIDHIVGMIHLKDLFLLAQDSPESSIRDIIRPVQVLPENNSVDSVWHTLQQSQNYMALLFDEYGGTVGLLTLEDIIEEIIGEVQDEFDAELAPIRAQADKEILVRGDVLLHVINKKFLLHLDTSQADTIGGFMLHQLEQSPPVGSRVGSRVGAQVNHDGVILKVAELDDNAVSMVSIELPQASHEDWKHEVQA